MKLEEIKNSDPKKFYTMKGGYDPFGSQEASR
jgi:hypothetical protein